MSDQPTSIFEVPSTEVAPAEQATVAGAVSAETEALLEILRRGLAPTADASAQAMARDVCARILLALSPLSPTPAAPFVPLAPGAAPTAGFVPSVAVPTPTSPLAAMVGTLRNLPPDQLLDMAIQRLRAVLPAGATVAEPKGIQFQLVPVTPPGGKR